MKVTWTGWDGNWELLMFSWWKNSITAGIVDSQSWDLLKLEGIQVFAPSPFHKHKAD
jgi:hypothetical protein